MATITTTRATERLSRKLQRAGISQWVGQSSGDRWGKYLLFEVGGKCLSGCGWTLKEAEEIVDRMIDAREAAARPAPTCRSIADAYRHFCDLHGSDAPWRTDAELRDYIHARGLRYDELDAAFWDGLFESGWHLGNE